jgi:hypothetical protein
MPLMHDDVALTRAQVQVKARRVLLVWEYRLFDPEGFK